LELLKEKWPDNRKSGTRIDRQNSDPADGSLTAATYPPHTDRAALLLIISMRCDNTVLKLVVQTYTSFSRLKHSMPIRI
jgi:hypothetical protein